MISNQQAGLDYSDLILLAKDSGYVTKTNIGELIESYLSKNEKKENSLSKEISGIYVTSFNPITFSCEKEEIIGITRTKSDLVYDFKLDDNSNIRLANNTSCYRFENCTFEKIEAKDVKLGDYFPLSNMIIQSKKLVKNLNLLDFNPNRKVNVKQLIEKNNNCSHIINEFLEKEFTSSKGKLKHIIRESKSRGISIDQMYKLLSILNLSLEKSNKDILVITKGKDKTNPIIPISHQLAFFSGLYLAEGTTTKTTIHISNSNSLLQSRCQELAQLHQINHYQANKNDIAYHSVLFANFFTSMGENAYSKQVPSIFYNIAPETLSSFLGAIFDGDGWVEPNSICYLSASQELVFDIKNLLLRFNISSRIRRKKSQYQKTNGDIISKQYFLLTVTGKENLELFLEKIPFLLEYKEKALRSTIKTKANTNVDLIPNCGSYIKSLRETTNISQKVLSSHVGCSRSYISMLERNLRFPSKKIFSRIIDFDKTNKDIRNLLKFNFRYVVQINKRKTQNGYVYGIITENNNAFCAGYGNIFIGTNF